MSLDDAFVSPVAGEMPDVASQGSAGARGTLNRVGMARIEVPVRLRDDDGMPMLCPAKAEAYVSLDDPDSRGIHMSRLFLSLQSILSEEELGIETIKRLLQAFIGSHTGMSRSSYVRLDFDLLVKRKALISKNSSWRTYPVVIIGECRDGRYIFRLGVTVAYSSTCPCSAALARQLIQDRFRQDFAGKPAVTTEEVAAWLILEESICATPHSQRSYAKLEVEIADEHHAPTFVQLIDVIEGALKTAVQAAVKREDEQEFARLNGQNLMFCEDAGRRCKEVLERDPRFLDYRLEATHVESLHPHDAVSVVVKGMPGGYRA